MPLNKFVLFVFYLFFYISFKKCKNIEEGIGFFSLLVIALTQYSAVFICPPISVLYFKTPNAARSENNITPNTDTTIPLSDLITLSISSFLYP